MTSVLTLSTPRLTFRAMSLDDWPAYFDMPGSDRSRRMGGPFAMEEAWGIFCSDHAQWQLFGCGALIMDLTDSGKTIGQVGINSGPLFPEPEIGWFLHPGFEGSGYACEAAMALLHWARGIRQLKRLVSYVKPENERSRNLAVRLGAVRDEKAARRAPGELVFCHFGRASTADACSPKKDRPDVEATLSTAPVPFQM
ncbi:MAG: GNAT family N-acetyltransferase [Pseudomonadota bacterium]